jgi:hypothetical protein
MRLIIFNDIQLKTFERVVNRYFTKKFDWFKSIDLKGLFLERQHYGNGYAYKIICAGIINVDEKWGRERWENNHKSEPFPGNKDLNYDSGGGVKFIVLLDDYDYDDITQSFVIVYRAINFLDSSIDVRSASLGRMLIQFESGEKETLKETIKRVLKERCWAGYTQKGMKTMFGKRYPNCVKKKKK